MTTHNTSASTGTADIAAAVVFQRDLYLYWWAARELGELALTTRGYLARPALRRLRAQWPVSDDDRAEADDPRLYYLRRLLERLGLLRPSTEATKAGGHVLLVAAESAVMARYLAHPLAERIRICARLWVAGGWWHDGRLAGVATGLHTPMPPRIALTRRRLLETLAATEPNNPIDIPGMAQPLVHAPRIIGATAGRRKPRDIAEERNETMRAALDGPLQWMGLVVRGEPDALDERRLVVSEAALALRAEASEASEAPDAHVYESPGKVIIQPNLDIVVYPPLTAPTLFALDSCATRGSLERVAHYRLTRDGLAQAQRLGWADEEVTRRLEELAGVPLPGNVRVRLADWARAANRIALTPRATLLSTTTPALLDALLADRHGRNWVVRRLGPTLALTHTDEIESVRRWLLERGELPAVESADC